ncbi:MerR family transcriptional regulator [Metabacillus hrfriensis]|uniref:MerR family transcriptional regulator n=1 Tax=Metabacillus hrfriensis TaxID=3048891 RepID=A0ACD4RA20_9BACI|nr:MerR family transcriptional regulator [Metabacillus sp. CT-WN-B3]USK27980.1 MerR family transcriptional regulator [Bacillus sp. CMF21]WHZ57188.1 MerR family transcriptional regulator [Metabacillus sp. CT-WN-B3]
MYRIGELAKLANVSKRTIDYYTQIGLLHVDKTSKSNYRLYSEQALNDIQFIEECKLFNMCLQDIKERLELKRSQTNEEDKLIKQAEILAKHMKQLEHEIKELKPIFDKMNGENQEIIASRISPQSMALMQSLMILLH